MATGTTSDFQESRDSIVKAAYRKCGLGSRDQPVTPEQIDFGKDALNAIMREVDASGDHLWAQGTETITLVANQSSYSLTNNVRKIIRAFYRDPSGDDSEITVYNQIAYERLTDKNEVGDPTGIYIPETRIRTAQTAKVHPILGSVNTQSVVVGTDGNDYKCITNHTSSSSTKPITGADYLLYWEATGGSGAGAVWATDTSYIAPQLVRILYQRPLYDFDLKTDNPDMPQAWTRFLIYSLATDIADELNQSNERIGRLAGKARIAYRNIFPSTVEQTRDFHNKGVFF